MDENTSDEIASNSSSSEPVIANDDTNSLQQEIVNELHQIRTVEEQIYMNGVNGHITDTTLLESLSGEGEFYSSEGTNTYDYDQLQSLNQSIVYLNGMMIAVSVILTILLGVVVGRIITDRLHR